MTLINRKWILKQRPTASLATDDLQLVEAPAPSPIDGEILIRNIYLSLDPTNRIWMSDREQYLPPVGLGDVMRGTTLGVVVESRSDRFAPGDLVLPPDGGWQLYTIADASQTRRVKREPGVPLTAYLSVLGVTGLTAYVGVMDICRPKAGETFVVTAGAGAVGSVAGQIAAIQGARVVGIAGGPAKTAWLTGELGFDGAVDYKGEDVGAALDRLCPDGIDSAFENVGGPIMDAVYERLNTGGRVAVCGLISNYNDEGPIPGPKDFGRMLMKRLTVSGFIVIDHFHRARDAWADIGRWIAEGRLQWKDHVVDGLENAPDALGLLFTGANDGKLVIRISDEPEA